MKDLVALADYFEVDMDYMTGLTEKQKLNKQPNPLAGAYIVRPQAKGQMQKTGKPPPIRCPNKP